MFNKLILKWSVTMAKTKQAVDHLRKKKDGSFAWIPEMWVGSIENGLIVHDYVADRELKGQG